MMALLYLIGAFHPWTARAEADKVGAAIASVQRLYEELEYERALEQARRARRIQLSVNEGITLSLYEGILLAELGKHKEAADAFRAGLSLAARSPRKEVRLPTTVSPKIEQIFEAARRELQRAESAPPAEMAESTKAPQGTGSPILMLPEEETQGSVPRVEERGSALLRPLVPGIAGGVLLVAGVGAWGLAKREQSKLRQNDPGPTTPSAVQRVTSRGRAYQTVGFSLMGASAVSFGIAAGLYVLQDPDAPVTLGAGVSGKSVFIHGRWP